MNSRNLLRFTSAVFLTLALSARDSQASEPVYTAHEWGTFTSVQGPDGVPLAWRPLRTSSLPAFVYNWNKPGLGRIQGGLMSKGSMMTLQRMETPVIYFHSDEEFSVDVSVDFPKGIITEWYPQAFAIGPSLAYPLTDTGPSESAHTRKESRAEWKQIRVLPAERHGALERELPQGDSGEHYFAARGARSTYLRLDSGTNQFEHEKFIFYRGAGSFSTPLAVSMASDTHVVVTNEGPETLTHLFVMQVGESGGRFIHIPQLSSGERHDVRIVESAELLSRTEMQSRLSDQMMGALVREGLFEDEARAMVETWKDSWFTEEGTRVLYLLPRKWTDATLPISFKPAPSNLTRVMVGRTEVLSPTGAGNLREQIAASFAGDETARLAVGQQLRRLGRFSEAALVFALKESGKAEREFAWKLMAGVVQ